jgi:hypothetical protein
MVRILGEQITVEYDGEMEDYGHFILESRTIKLKPDQDREDQTVLHELIHAALRISGLDEVLGPESEEAVCRCLEVALPQAYRMSLRKRG